ncbi:ubiquinone biosynthesis protein UbiA [Antarcticibacterium flavum]|uniref:Ubiquinone biosynthesis protein UbiA n=1 Tax=Antarcticibacterium flavum TaxID=2058175 RepID=A0A5B7X549_9FLAO|nr:MULTISPECIES: geranylgeranylglycerol-phosphate geranylgeranyltransferase [Antarcticibacterium]MCM4159500.1 ubiquinone biosynthesis protein UbiA [Antarcticibacterium sp. W02-3]QCY69868.1 ubiquinone biosynthesis protein UbiA [Antarcticibacterium flavum]
MAAAKNKRLMLKMLSLFSVVRGYNILVLVIAQYLTSAFILAPELPLREVIFDDYLFFLILSSATVIASGYIINNFYDSEKDLINRPRKTMLDRFISQRTKLSVYFILNFAAIFFASYVSFRAVVFFSIYIFMIWVYSYRIKRILFLGNLVASILAIIPFFVVFIYYKNFETVIFIHATFLYLMIVMRELVKDLENLKGDLIQNYKTIPVVYGENWSKFFLSILTVIAIIPILLLTTRFDIGLMDCYFYVSLLLLVFFVLFLYFSTAKWQYLLLHNILKLIIVAGVFSILLIEPSEVLNRVF